MSQNGWQTNKNRDTPGYTGHLKKREEKMKNSIRMPRKETLLLKCKYAFNIEGMGSKT